MMACTLLVPGLLLGLDLAQAAAGPQVPQRLLEARRDAARRTYDELWKKNQEALLPVAELAYRWSLRWLEAERDLSEQKPNQVAAFQAHSARMRELERISRDRFRTRTNPIEEVTAAEFYAVEAEIWLLRAKNK